MLERLNLTQANTFGGIHRGDFVRKGAVAAEVSAGGADELPVVDPPVHPHTHADHLTSPGAWIGLILHPNRQTLGCTRDL